MVKGASLYSKACSTVNRIPSVTVISNEITLAFILLLRMA
jgi:hypothetical protein